MSEDVHGIMAFNERQLSPGDYPVGKQIREVITITSSQSSDDSTRSPGSFSVETNASFNKEPKTPQKLDGTTTHNRDVAQTIATLCQVGKRSPTHLNQNTSTYISAGPLKKRFKYSSTNATTSESKFFSRTPELTNHNKQEDRPYNTKDTPGYLLRVPFSKLSSNIPNESSHVNNDKQRKKPVSELESTLSEERNGSVSDHAMFFYDGNHGSSPKKKSGPSHKQPRCFAPPPKPPPRTIPTSFRKIALFRHPAKLALSPSRLDAELLNEGQSSESTAESLEDDGPISYMCFLRQHLEFFKVTRQLVHVCKKMYNLHIDTGQVGLRCRYCASIPFVHRPKRSTIVAKTNALLYEYFDNRIEHHSERCHFVPGSIRKKIRRLRERNLGSGRESFRNFGYWLALAKTEGVVETSRGLRFKTSLIGMKTDAPFAQSTSPFGFDPRMNLNSNDVLCGREEGTRKHLGNSQFWHLVQSKTAECNYHLYSEEEQVYIAVTIVTSIRSMTPPGQFLAEDTNTGSWNNLGETKAIQVTRQALDTSSKRHRPMANESNALPFGRGKKPYNDRWTQEENTLLLRGHEKLGKKWIEISTKLFDLTRSASQIKARWYSLSVRKVLDKKSGSASKFLRQKPGLSDVPKTNSFRHPSHLYRDYHSRLTPI